MYTDILFINRSLNTNVSKVGMFMGGEPRLTQPDEEPELVLWRLIENCGYDWRHPVRIWHAPSLQVHDFSGNVCGSEPVSSLLSENAANTSKRLALKVEAAARGDVLNVWPTGNRQLAQIAVIRGGQATAIKPLAGPGQLTQIDISNRLMFCADMDQAAGTMITIRDLNVSLASFDLTNISSMTVYMKGGQRGPKSRAIKFLAADICRW